MKKGDKENAAEDRTESKATEKSEDYSTGKKSNGSGNGAADTEVRGSKEASKSFPSEKTANWPTKIGKPSRNLNAVGWPKVKTSAKTTL